MKAIFIEFYEGELYPTKSTSFEYVWLPYYRFYVNDKGEVDLVFIPSDTVVYLKKKRINYNYEVTIAENY